MAYMIVSFDEDKSGLLTHLPPSVFRPTFTDYRQIITFSQKFFPKHIKLLKWRGRCLNVNELQVKVVVESFDHIHPLRIPIPDIEELDNGTFLS